VAMACVDLRARPRPRANAARGPAALPEAHQVCTDTPAGCCAPGSSADSQRVQTNCLTCSGDFRAAQSRSRQPKPDEDCHMRLLWLFKFAIPGRSNPTNDPAAEQNSPAVHPQRRLKWRRNGFTERLQKALRDDGFYLTIYVGPLKVLDELSALATNAAVETAAIRAEVRRLESALPSDPSMAIGRAKNLVEGTAKAILVRRGMPVDNSLSVQALASQAGSRSCGSHHGVHEPTPTPNDSSAPSDASHRPTAHHQRTPPTDSAEPLRGPLQPPPTTPSTAAVATTTRPPDRQARPHLKTTPTSPRRPDQRVRTRSCLTRRSDIWPTSGTPQPRRIAVCRARRSGPGSAPSSWMRRARVVE
jgi:hypothetical protein